jgi:16S rRNA C967 or C1407 C5-methylase (RsmB/RsmF family)
MSSVESRETGLVNETVPVSAHYDALHLLLPRFLRIMGFNKLKSDQYVIGTIDTEEKIIATTIDRLISLYEASTGDRHIETNQARKLIHVVKWMPGFLALPGYIELPTGGVKALMNIGLYAMDVASAVAIQALRLPNSEVCGMADNDAGASPYRVLDLCCCPGAKLAMIRDELTVNDRDRNRQTHVVGVDVSKQRLTVCKSLLLQTMHYQYSNLNNINMTRTVSQDRLHVLEDLPRLSAFQSDGTTFKWPTHISSMVHSSDNVLKSQLIFDTNAVIEEVQAYKSLQSHIRDKDDKDGISAGSKRPHACQSSSGSSMVRLEDHIIPDNNINTFIRTNKSAKKRESQSLKSLQNEMSVDAAVGIAPLFDRVLVDAECSHDGSYRHMRYTNGKFDSVDISEESVTTTDRKQKVVSLHSTAGTELRDLQRNLLLNGYTNCKPGGIIVYSTCSLDDRQNADIVKWLLMHPVASGATLLSPLPTPSSSSSKVDNDNEEVKRESEEEVDEEIVSLLALPLNKIHDQVCSGSPNTVSAMRDISLRICTQVSHSATVPIHRQQLYDDKGNEKIGTVGLMSKLSGTSGLFVATIQKGY